MAVGGEDYTRDMGVARTREGRELDHVRHIVAHVCIANGLLPLDTVYADFRDEQGLIAETELAQSMGFKGKYVIHPGQIEAVNRCLHAHRRRDSARAHPPRRLRRGARAR